ncbi:MAG TPA: 50S ribosomal protein L23 [Patescibacteria group bacterium]
MGLLDKITGKKEESKKTQKKSDENVLELAHEHDEKPVALKENTGSAHRVLKHHHLSEKTNAFATTGRYVFKVSKDANKIEVKKAVEKVYDVHVAKVNMVNVPGKKRRQGRVTGRTQDWKKAIVFLKTGERIAGLAEGA